MRLTSRQRFTMASKYSDFTITTPTYDGSGPNKTSVRGFEITIEGLEQFRLFMHRPITGNINKGWKVSEVSTGLSITGQTYRTQKEAIEEVIEHVKDRGGVDSLAKNIANHLFHL